MYKFRFESRDEVQLPFDAQGVAANMCDATKVESMILLPGSKKLYLKL